MTDDLDPRVAEWAARLATELGLDTDVDVRAVLGVAGVAAHAVVRPAAPVTTYLLGFAAGRATASGEDPEAAFAEAVRVARDLAAGQ